PRDRHSFPTRRSSDLGQTALGTVTADPLAAGQFDVAGTHTYAEEGSFNVSVTITGRGGSTTRVQGAAVVGDAALTAAGVGVSARSEEHTSELQSRSDL